MRVSFFVRGASRFRDGAGERDWGGAWPGRPGCAGGPPAPMRAPVGQVGRVPGLLSAPGKAASGRGGRARAPGPASFFPRRHRGPAAPGRPLASSPGRPHPAHALAPSDTPASTPLPPPLPPLSPSGSLLPIREKGNWLMCTLLIANTVANVFLPILVASFAGGLVGFITSTILILLLAEIVPQVEMRRGRGWKGNAGEEDGRTHFIHFSPRFFFLSLSFRPSPSKNRPSAPATASSWPPT